MDTNIKEGTRVKVLRLNGEDVDFYATLKPLKEFLYANMCICSDNYFENKEIYLPNHEKFGKEKQDYFITVSEENKNTPSLNSEIDTLISAINANNIVITGMVYEFYHTNTLVIKINQEVFVNVSKDPSEYRILVYFESKNREYGYDTWLSAIEDIVEHLKTPKEGDKLSKHNNPYTYQIIRISNTSLYNIVNLDTSTLIYTKHLTINSIRELIKSKKYEIIK